MPNSYKLNENFSIIHLSTGHDGGAGLAARRLNTALINAGVNSQFVALKNKGYVPQINENSLGRNLLVKILSAAISKFQSNLSNKFFFSIYSLNVFSISKLKKIADPKNSILHIHNWFNLVNQKQIAKFLKLGYLVVVTLHDERFYTGGCHHAFDCSGFKNDCFACPQISTPIKYIPRITLKNSTKNLKISASKNLYFIAPSLWIYNRARESNLIKHHVIYFIPNSLGEFGAIENKLIRRKIDFDNPKIIGIASKDPNSYIKGGDVVRSLDQLIKRNSLSYKITFLSELTNTQQPERNFWESIDLLLVPSRADNSPNVIHEAKKLGIPVIATMVGGITEMLDPEFDELIPIENLTAENILQRLQIRKNNKKEFSAEKMKKKFDSYLNNPVSQHIEVYNKLISEKK
jgi:glycosyltransferase involved in cell wall biosynthesis